MTRRQEPASTGSGRVSQNAPKSQSLSAAVWEHIERVPGVMADIVRGEEQIAAGKKTPLAEIRNRR